MKKISAEITPIPPPISSYLASEIANFSNSLKDLSALQKQVVENYKKDIELLRSQLPHLVLPPLSTPLKAESKLNLVNL
jgi:hypothetical protein